MFKNIHTALAIISLICIALGGCVHSVSQPAQSQQPIQIQQDPNQVLLQMMQQKTLGQALAQINEQKCLKPEKETVVIKVKEKMSCGELKEEFLKRCYIPKEGTALKMEQSRALPDEELWALREE